MNVFKSKTTYFLLAALLISCGLAACAGLDIGDFVKVKTPATVQQQTGLPPALTLNEAESEYEAWFQDVQRTGVEWKQRIARSSEVAGLFRQLSLQGLADVGPTLAGVPVAGPAIPVLTALAGLFLGRAPLRKEKEASFNKGLSEGAKAAKGS